MVFLEVRRHIIRQLLECWGSNQSKDRDNVDLVGVDKIVFLQLTLSSGATTHCIASPPPLPPFQL